MSRTTTALFALIVCAMIASPLAAQGKPPTVAIGYTLEVLPGHQAQFEAAIKQQVDWYKKNGETWQWHTWRIDTGEDFGKYVFRSPAHYWKDMDDRAERGARARAQFMEVVRPHLASISSGISAVLPSISRWPESDEMFPMVSVWEFKVHYGMAEEFAHTIGRIHEAIEKAAWPVHYAWLTVVSGGEVPTFLLVVPRKNWADMEGPEKEFRVMLDETMGHAGADEVLASLARCVRQQTAMLATFQPDLSYFPPDKK